MKTIGIGVIGCGGRILSLLEILFKQTQEVRLTALCDPRTEAVEQFRAKFNPEARVHADCEALARDPAVDWVMIGSWNCLHREHAVAALHAGKHVFCEKPLATNLEDGLAMRDAWRKTKLHFGVGFTLRYSPHYREIKRLVDAGAIGRLVSMEFNETLEFNHGGYIMGDWRRLTQNAGTHLLEKCCHDVDIVNWIVGSTAQRVASFGGLNFFKPENIKHQDRLGVGPNGRKAYEVWGGSVRKNPFTSDKDIVDNQVAIIEFENQVRATFHTNCNAGIVERRMYLAGTEGAIRSDVVEGKIELRRTGFDAPLEDHSTSAKGGHGGGDEVLVASLLDSMLTGAPPLASLDDGLKSAVTCFGIDHARETGAVVEMEPWWRKVRG